MNNTLFRWILTGSDVTSSRLQTWNVSSILQDLLEKTKQRDIAKYQDLDFDAEFLKSDEKVERLLAQYATYAMIFECKKSLSKQSKDSFDRLLAALDVELNTIWDEMKFDNPYIWMKYKLMAYKNDSHKKIETIWDLILHCSPGWDICSKRLRFFNGWLLKHFSIDINTLDPEIRVEDFINHPEIRALSVHSEFISDWLYYEYYQIGSKVAKWSNYNTGKGMGNWKNYWKSGE